MAAKLLSYQENLDQPVTLSGIIVYANPMVRPLKPDREAIALTTIRMSAKTRRLLADLKKKHGFATTDQLIRYYLPSNVSDNRPVFHSAKVRNLLSYRKP